MKFKGKAVIIALSLTVLTTACTKTKEENITTGESETSIEESATADTETDTSTGIAIDIATMENTSEEEQTTINTYVNTDLLTDKQRNKIKKHYKNPYIINELYDRGEPGAFYTGEYNIETREITINERQGSSVVGEEGGTETIHGYLNSDILHNELVAMFESGYLLNSDELSKLKLDDTIPDRIEAYSSMALSSIATYISMPGYIEDSVEEINGQLNNEDNDEDEGISNLSDAQAEELMILNKFKTYDNDKEQLSTDEYTAYLVYFYIKEIEDAIEKQKGYQ